MTSAIVSRRVEVAPIGSLGAPARLTYAVPETLETSDSGLAVGTCVRVPLGPRTVEGVVLGPSTGPPPPGLRAITGVLAGRSLPSELVALCTWAARYYHVGLASLLRIAAPPGLSAPHRRQVVLLPAAADGHIRQGLSARDAGLLDRLGARGIDLELLRSEAGRGVDAALRRLRRLGVLDVRDVAVSGREHSIGYRLGDPSGGPLPPPPQRGRRQQVFALVAASSPHPLTRESIEQRIPGGGRTAAELAGSGLLERVTMPSEEEAPTPPSAAPLRTLRAEQQAAAAAIAAGYGRFAPFLLYGVTGSGKTEVYLRAAADALATGRGVLILVPEIGLTHQLVDEVQRRFGSGAAVLHSGLGDLERRQTWQRVASGRARLVIGARSAALAPIHDLALIVVDEEHDGAYKQEETPRYQARDLAVMRGKLAGCPVVLSSATPALESWHAATTGRYELLRLRERANAAPLPVIECIDLRSPEITGSGSRNVGSAAPDRRPSGPRSPLAPALADALRETYSAGEQSILFLNRRGFARVVQCDACGWVAQCPNCSVTLTFHREQRRLACHHCGHGRPVSALCPECRCLAGTLGAGTERIEESVRELLPRARIARLDRDTGTSPARVRRTLDAWRAHELDVLVGTQMIAKGHDVPGVTLIGVVLADSSLSFPDFRAAEHTFQLVTQVAGRAGRGGRPGRVLVQTYQPDHPALVAAAAHDFEGFATREIAERAPLGYPPFGRLARIILEGPDAAETERFASDVVATLRAAGSAATTQILGPAPAPIERLRGRHRFQILVKSPTARALGTLLDAWSLAASPARATSSAPRSAQGRQPERVRTILDVDPASML